MKEFRLLYLIGDIQDKFILEAAQEQQDTRRGGFSKKIRYCALGLCAAMALCAGLVVYTQFQRTSDSLVGRPKVTTAVTDDDVQIANPFQECTDLSEAAQIAGFSITAPDSCVNSSGKVIQAIQNDMIEIIYQDDAGNGLAPAKSAETITYMRTILPRKLTARVYTFVETADWSMPQTGQTVFMRIL